MISEELAIQFLKFFLGYFEGGYNPDNRIDEYIDGSTDAPFGVLDAFIMQMMHDQMLEVFEDRIYDKMEEIRPDLFTFNKDV